MISTKVVKITPEMAGKMLQNNQNNRPLVLRHVNALARAMSDGEWELNGETIKISKCGQLLDGQHRLEAIIKTGIPCSMVVIKGLQLEVFNTIDTGSRIRNAGDVLAISGEKNYNTLASAARLLKCWEQNKSSPMFKGRDIPISVKQIQDTIKKHPNIRLYSSYKQPYMTKFLSGSVVCFLAYLFHKISKEKAERFFNDLISGENLDKGDAILLLRNKLLFNAADYAKLPREAIIALVIKAWNSHYNGIKINKLTYEKNEKFPLISGVK